MSWFWPEAAIPGRFPHRRTAQMAVVARRRSLPVVIANSGGSIRARPPPVWRKTTCGNYSARPWSCHWTNARF